MRSIRSRFGVWSVCLGKAVGLALAVGPVTVLLPVGGIGLIAVPGQPFHDPAADDALFSSIRKWLSPGIPLIEVDCAINDPLFAEAWVERLSAS